MLLLATITDTARDALAGLRRLYTGGPFGNETGLGVASPESADVPEVTGVGSRVSGIGSATPDTPYPMPETSLKGAVGTANFAGFVRDLGEYNPQFEGRSAFPIYEKMRRSDADVAAALMACKLPIRAAEWQILPGVKANDPGFARAKELADFARENLFGGLESPTRSGAWSTQTFESVLENALLDLDFGCVAHEDLWHIDQERVRLRKLAPRLPLTFYRFHVDADGETLLALEQYGYRGDQFVNVLLPAEKIALFTVNQEGAYWYGRSLLRPAYKHWWFKDQAYRISAIAIERNAAGIPVIKQGPNASAEDRSAAQTWGKNLATHENTFLSLPNAWDLEIAGIRGRILDPHAFIQHQSEMIMRSVLANFLSLGSTETGSRALGGAMRDFFLLSLEAAARRIGETISNTSLRRLIDYNFDKDSGFRIQDSATESRRLNPESSLPYPRLVCGRIVALNPLEVATALRDLADARVDILQPDDDTENGLRERFGLPPKSKKPRPRFAPIVQRITETEAGTVPEEPGEKFEKSGDRGIGESGDRGIGRSGDRGIGKSGDRQNTRSPDHPIARSSDSLAASEARSTRVRDQVSPFWREGDDPRLRNVHVNEMHMDFGAHQAAIDRAQQTLLGILRRARPKLARRVADRFAAALKRGTAVLAVGFDHDPELAAALEPALRELYAAAQTEFRVEHERLHKAGGQDSGFRIQDSATPPLSPLLGEEGSPKGGAVVPVPGPQLRAELTVQDVLADIAQAGRKAALDLAADGEITAEMQSQELADEIYQEIEDTAYVDEGIDKAAGEAAASAWREGRGDAAEEIAEALRAIGIEPQFVRIAILDKNVCGPCERADGAPVKPDADLSKICDGGKLCRCQVAEEQYKSSEQ